MSLCPTCSTWARDAADRCGEHHPLCPARAPEMPTLDCPSCKAEQADFDGLGFAHCPACGYCVHASATGPRGGPMTCNACGAEVPEF